MVLLEILSFGYVPPSVLFCGDTLPPRICHLHLFQALEVQRYPSFSLEGLLLPLRLLLLGMYGTAFPHVLPNVYLAPRNCHALCAPVIP